MSDAMSGRCPIVDSPAGVIGRHTETIVPHGSFGTARDLGDDQQSAAAYGVRAGSTDVGELEARAAIGDGELESYPSRVTSTSTSSSL